MSLLTSSPLCENDEVLQDDAPPPVRPRWRDHFRCGCRGVKLGIRSRSSFSVHCFFAALGLLAAVILRCSPQDWCLLVLGIGLVLCAEFFHSALTVLIRGLDDDMQRRCRHCLVISTGAVLLACVVAVGIGAIVFLNRLIQIAVMSQ